MVNPGFTVEWRVGRTPTYFDFDFESFITLKVYYKTLDQQQVR